MILASCAHCGEFWTVKTSNNPDVLQGVCGDCQRDSVAEKPLDFYWLPVPDSSNTTSIPELPPEWLT
jgi:hypothetical protein